MIKHVIYWIFMALSFVIAYGISSEDWDNRSYDPNSVYNYNIDYDDDKYYSLIRCPQCRVVGPNIEVREIVVGGPYLCRHCGYQMKKFPQVIGIWRNGATFYKPWTWIGDCGWEITHEQSSTQD